MQKQNPYKKGGMFEGALHTIFENSKENRKKMTAAETVLWMHLRKGINGCKFRRQHPIGMYIADFYCHKAKLIIEIDGRIHLLEAVKQNDQEKERFLSSRGYSVLRFTNEEEMNHREEAISKIRSTRNTNICKHTPDNGVNSPL